MSVVPNAVFSVNFFKKLDIFYVTKLFKFNCITFNFEKNSVRLQAPQTSEAVQNIEMKNVRLNKIQISYLNGLPCHMTNH